MRLAIGMTAAQVSAGTDETLRNWLAEPSTAQMVARVYAPDAVIRWLHAPQIYPGKVSGCVCVWMDEGVSECWVVLWVGGEGAKKRRSGKAWGLVVRVLWAFVAWCDGHTV